MSILTSTLVQDVYVITYPKRQKDINVILIVYLDFQVVKIRDNAAWSEFLGLAQS